MISPHCENDVVEYRKVGVDVESMSSLPNGNMTTTDSSLLHENMSVGIEKSKGESITMSKKDMPGIVTSTSTSTSTSSNDDNLDTTSTPILFPVDLPDYGRSLESMQSSEQQKVAPSTPPHSSRNIIYRQWKRIKKAIVSIKKHVCHNKV